MESGRIAQEENTEMQYTWLAADSPIQIDLANTVLPEGFQVVEDGNNIKFMLRSTSPGIFAATITVTQETAPGNLTDWTGPPIRRTNTVTIPWIVYRNSMSPFLTGFGDLVLEPSA